MARLSMFLPSYPVALIYMLQSTEYQAAPYLAWFWRVKDFRRVAHRRQLHHTNRARMLLLLLWTGIVIELCVGGGMIGWGLHDHHITLLLAGCFIVAVYPLLWAHLIVLPIIMARQFIVRPKEKALMNRAQQQFASTKAVKIAIAGSYGKTTMKELLHTVLSEGKNVAASPANKNVIFSHAAFAATLSGKEEVIVLEYGEGQPGDVPRFNKLFQPTIGVITGLAPAHLDKYKIVQAAGKDIFSLADYVGPKNIFINNEAEAVSGFIQQGQHVYNRIGALGWKVGTVEVTLQGMDLTLRSGKKSLKLHTGLVGEHLIGPLVLCVAFAKELGLSDAQIKAGVAKTRPFEHRMEPRPLAGGWIIDDTYNGNLEGVRAGLALLKTLKAKRKTYVTPGLVDQGDASETVHRELGRLIADAGPERVVLMRHTVTPWIEAGLKEGGYNGELRIEDDPLDFYTKLEHLIAVGDVVMMQNDWPDNYN